MAAKPQVQAVHDQVTKDRVRGTEFLELLEDQPDHPAGLLVGLLDDLARGRLEVAQGDGQEQLAALRLVPAPAEQAIAQRHQLEFAHGAPHPQEQAVVPVQGVVDAVLIAEQRVEDAAHVDELMPVLVGPRQPAQLQPQHDPHVVQAHLRHQPLEARPLVGRLAAPALILVDDHHALGRPAEPLRELCQGILPFARLAVLEHLLGGRLPHVHDREPIEVPVLNLGRGPQAEGRGRRGHPSGIDLAIANSRISELIAHLRVVVRSVELSKHDPAEGRQRSLTLLVGQQTPESIERQRPNDSRARGEQGLIRFSTWVSSLHCLILDMNPFRQPQQAGQRDYGCAREFL